MTDTTSGVKSGKSYSRRPGRKGRSAVVTHPDGTTSTDPKEEKRLIEVLNEIDISNKEKLSSALEGIIKKRLVIEDKMLQDLWVALSAEQITVDEAIGYLKNITKDSTGELIKVKRLNDGEKDGSTQQLAIINYLGEDGFRELQGKLRKVVDYGSGGNGRR